LAIFTKSGNSTKIKPPPNIGAIQYLSSSEGEFFNKSSSSPWIQTIYFHLIADLFLYSYETEFIQQLSKDKSIREAEAFDLTIRSIDDALY
jgi:hypothetical protein